MARVRTGVPAEAAEAPLAHPPGLAVPGAGAAEEAVLEAVRDAVLREVDARMAAKTEELWAKGKQAMAQLQQAHRETAGRLVEQVAACQERQRTLEAENEALRQLVQTLSAQLAALGPALHAKGAGEEREESTALGSSPSLTHDSPEPYAHGASTPRSDSIAGQPMMVSSEGLTVDGLGKHASFCHFSTPTTPVSPTTPLLPPSSLDAAFQQRPPAFINSLAPSAPIGLGTPPALVAKSNFTFTLRKADGVELGLHVSHHENDKVIRVEGIKPDGAIGAWNRQWVGSGTSQEKVVTIGDRIISVNGVVNDPHKMLQECKEKQLLKIEILRGDQPSPTTPPDAATANKPAGLRAEAAAFVPKSNS